MRNQTIKNMFIPFISILFLSFSLNLLAADAKTENPLANLKFRALGPAAGGRVLAVAGVPGNPNIYYFGAAAGGVFKTTDGGLNWIPLFEKEPVASIGAIAIAASDPNIVWVGTGEACIRGDISFGNGVYKSVDGGKTWSHMGLDDTRHIGQLIIDPRNPDIVLVAALGHAYGSNEERGVFRTTDGGKTWQKVLYKDANTGASAVAFDPNNSHIVYAGLWQAQRTPWSLSSGGPGSGLYKSVDGGVTWKQLTGHGLPKGIMGKVGVAVAPSDSNRVYALIESKEGALWRSDDGGENWHMINAEHALNQRAWYYTHIVVDPKDENVVYCPQVPLLKSIDGGKTFQTISQPHGDNHALWIDPQNSNRIIDGNDGGVVITTDGAHSWLRPPLPISQFYHVAADNRSPYFVCGEIQDLGSSCGPSRSLAGGRISENEWYDVGGGESGFAVPDPVDYNIVYANGYDGDITRYDVRTRQARVINVDPEDPMGWPAKDLKYRFQWTAPIMISSHNHNEVYLGGNRLFRTTDGGTTWTAISPDLTRDDKSKQESSGGPITKDNTSVEYYGTIFALAESPVQAGVLWAGSDDGLIHVSRDNGATWKNVTPPKSLLPEWGLISIIDASPHDAGTAYVAADFHKLDNFAPYLLKTTDYGATWTRIDSNLAALKSNYAHVVREDPARKGLLYAGTETSLWISFDDGGHWQSFQNNLPTAPVHDLMIQRAANDLLIATHGRSFYVLDNLAPLEQWSPKVEAEDVHLFVPRPTIRYRAGGFFRGSGATAVGQNPPNGVVVNYFLKSAPKGDVTLAFLDQAGKTVRSFTTTKKKTEESAEDREAAARERGAPAAPVPPKTSGMNQFVWDMRYQPPTLIEHGVLWNRGGTLGPLAVPGKYTVKLTVDGKDFTAPAEIIPDSRVTTSQADLEAQLNLSLTLRERMTSISKSVNQISAVQKQLTDLEKNLGDDPKFDSLKKTAKDLDQKFQDVKQKLYQTHLREVEDVLNYPIQLYNKFSALIGWVQSADAAPTQAEFETADELTGRLNAALDQFHELISKDLAEFNRQARQEDVPNILAIEGQK
ncbi:MAG: glycosyl hydrolase [Acidobacteriia bacterium]|nr:glycosyl hydrolase [Terriglobia bacterium]